MDKTDGFIKRNPRTLTIYFFIAVLLLTLGTYLPYSTASSGSDDSTTNTASPTETTAGPLTVEADDALAELEQLVIAEAERITYDVADFGSPWIDIDHNGCDTRNDMLRRDLEDITTKPGTDECVILTGTLIDLYTGEEVPFERVSEGYQPVQIDHLYPRKLAAQHGALDLTEEQRIQFANDPLNLQSTTANQEKGDSGPSEWMPTERYQCEYAGRFVAVAAKYSLSISQADHAALDRTLTSCTTGS